MPSELEKRFHDAMLRIYKRALEEAGYRATRFLEMVSQQGGLEAARALLHATQVSAGYVALWERGRLDLTVEVLVLEAQWKELFSDSEREAARQRLKTYGYRALSD